MTVMAQMYIFTQMQDLDKKTPEILNKLASAGYEAIEGMYGNPPHTKAEMKASGLKYFAPHLNPKALQPLDQIIKFCKEIGAEDICSSGPAEWTDRTTEDYKKTSALLNDLGRQLQAEGIHLHYHNHDFEFQSGNEEKMGIDLLLEGLDFDAVKFCLDVGWIWIAGVDAAKFVKDHAEKIGVVHMRDFKGRQSVALGQGEMNLDAIVAETKKLPNLRALAVEQDPSSTPLEDMIASREYLRKRFSL